MIQNIDSFVQALESSQPVAVNKKGEWYIEGCFRRFVRWITCRNDKRLEEVGKLFNRHLDMIEKTGVDFNIDQKDVLQKAVKASEAVLKALSTMKRRFSQKNLLEYRILALKYRYEGVNGGIDTQEEDHELTNTVRDLAKKWITDSLNEKICRFPENWIQKNGDLVFLEVEEQRFKESSRYPEFVKLIQTDKDIRNEYFTRTIRECLTPKAVIEFPGTIKRLRECYLTGDLGRFSYEDSLTVEKCNNNKVVTSIFDGERHSILDEAKTVTLKSYGSIPEIKLTIGEIFDDSARRNEEAQKYTFMGRHGFMNWCANLTRWHVGEKRAIPIDLEASNWLDQIPEYETVAAEDIAHRYKIDVHSIQSGRLLLVPMGSRQDANRKIDNCHGYFHLLHPKEDGTWRLMEFGKYATFWPTSTLDNLSFLDNTVLASVFCPDPNSCYSFRQLAAGKPHQFDPWLEQWALTSIRETIKKALTKNLVFQFAWESCAYWPQWLLMEIYALKSLVAEIEKGSHSGMLMANYGQDYHKTLANNPDAPKDIMSALHSRGALPEVLKNILGDDREDEITQLLQKPDFEAEIIFMLAEKDIPNLFTKDILASGSKYSFLDVIFRVIISLPKFIRPFCVWVCEMVLIPWRGTTVSENGRLVKKTLLKSPFHRGFYRKGKRRKFNIHLPSALHTKIEKNTVEGTLWYGHGRVQKV
ncbi:MAG: hypothetical protein H7A37_10215 [Chlamydiales bacterium]|nr:hypothetical protein [Chlamydiia bacterium]MCP5508651.1 hypothetical protein [Chlamydiales bacterium]